MRSNQPGSSCEEGDLEVRVLHRIHTSQKTHADVKMGINKPRCINTDIVYCTNTNQRCTTVSYTMYSVLVNLSLEHCVWVLQSL